MVHNSDHAGIQLISTLLNGDNYLNWSRSMKRALGARSKLEFIDGSLPEPRNNSPYYKSWLKADHLVFCWIMNSISKELVSGFVHIESSQRLWESIKQRFGRCNGPKVYRLERDIRVYVQGNQSVLMYFNNLTALWDELEMTLPPLNCICGAMSMAQKREEDRKLMQFLYGLSDHFENAREQILMMDPLPTVNKAYSMILQVEDQKSLTDTLSMMHHPVGMNVGNHPHNSKPSGQTSGQKKFTGNNGKGGNYKGKRLSKEERQKLRCNYCEEPGHEEAECFKLHGYPDWYKKLKAERGKSRINHVETPFDAAGMEESSDKVEGNSEISKMIQSEIAKCLGSFMQKQGKTQGSRADVNMIQEFKGDFDGHFAFSTVKEMKPNTWLLDSGASIHVCRTFLLLEDVIRLEVPLEIYLPDGRQKIIHFMGKIKISDDITLQDVLYTPDFTHNLISVAKMTRESSIKCMFLDTHCVMQRKQNDHIVGMAKVISGLYVIESVIPSYTMHAAISETTDYFKWHCNLGHPSVAIMKHMDLLQRSMTPTEEKQIHECESDLLAEDMPESVRDEEMGEVNVEPHGDHMDIIDDLQEPAIDDMITSSQAQHDAMITSPAHSPITAVRRGNRTRHPPTWMKDYVGNIKHSQPFHDSQGTRTPPTFPYFVSPLLTDSYRIFLINVDEVREPTSFTEANRSEAWRNAMDQELAALENNNTWELTTLPAGKKAIGSKWVYKVKLRANGTIERCKARLVAKGYNQQHGIDYNEVFSPVAKLETVRYLIAVATSFQWHLHQIDVNNAFFHGFLHDEIYMTPPQGYKKAKSGEVCKLVKSLYGLKHASREWNAEFTHKLDAYGFSQSSSDHCLFVKGNGENFIALLVYVDDVLITSPQEHLIIELKQYLDAVFTIKDLGEAKYFLGMEIVRGEPGTFLNQRKYILDLLKATGMLGSSSAVTPLPQGTQLASITAELLAEPESYRKLVGQLLYLNLTRPDISYAVQQLSQFVGKPCQHHWTAALHVLRYLNGCPSLGLFYPIDSSFKMVAYADADWGACAHTRRSLTGYCIFFGSALISWRCKKQTTVSVSSAEAEYHSLSTTTREMIWLSYLLQDFGISISLPIPLYCDNQAAIHITRNQVFHERTKHLEIDCHLVRDRFKSGFLEPLHLSTQEQLADFFTKSLGGPRFRQLMSKIGMKDIHARLAGG